MGQLTPDQQRELLGVYALDALDDDERAEVTELVLADESARAELHTLQLGVAWLDHASTGAPLHVWRAIEQEIAPEVKAPDTTVAPVVDLVARRTVRAERSRPRWSRVLAVAAAALALVAVTIGVLNANDDGDSSPTVAALAARADLRGATDAPLVTADGDRAGRVVVAADGHAYLVWSKAPAAAVGSRTYQLWELTPDGPRSAGLLGGDAADHAFHVGSDTTAVAVTLEPRGGSRAPTGSPVVTAALS
jgi:anti-sigma factor RsiW